MFTTVTSVMVGFFVASIEPTKASAGTGQGMEIGAPFADHMVLQRGMTVPVWGWSKPGTEVSVEFAGQKKSAAAGETGKWMLSLDSLDASAEPRDMTITEAGGKKRILKDILVGEVWMASGQSNMQWVASKCDVGQVLQKQIAARVAAGEEKPPVIREAKVTDFFACQQPIEHSTVEWKPGDGETSAIAYAFAYQLHRELGVPVGILNCSFSQTSIQAWTPREGFAGGEDEYTKAIYRKVLESDPSTPEHKAAWAKFYQDIETNLAENKALMAAGGTAKQIPTKAPGILNDNRDATWLFNARLNPMIPYAIRGCIWNQGYANINEGILYYENLHSLIRGWRAKWGRPDLPVYFNQFYCPGEKGDWDNTPVIDGASGMRMGTWLARDIPHTGMAIQIDITGAIHYYNKALSGQRLALHALKKQYGKEVVTDGPMFQSYEVKGDQLTVTLENAPEGLVVAETGANSKSGLAIPTLVPNGADQIKLFYLADENRVWHPAKIVRLEGTRVVVSAAGVKSPRGVSYAMGGVGNQPNLYNKAMLPTAPFIYFDNKLVTTRDWPDDPLKVAGVVPDPNAGGLLEEYRKLPILSTQFSDNAVLQADVPVTIWGSTVDFWVPVEKDKAVIKFSFDGIEKTIPVAPGMREWSVTLPAMKAGNKPYALKVRLEIDGELAHERTVGNMVFGDVFYIAAPALLPKIGDVGKGSGMVRMMTRKAKGSTSDRPRRFSVATSTSPPAQNRFASIWEDATGTAAAIGAKLSAGSGRPIGLIFMQSEKDKGKPDATLKEWIAADCLNLAPSLMNDYKELAGIQPGNDYYDANARRYIADWKKYWQEYVPAMIATKRVPDAAPWGKFPTLGSTVTTNASQTWNVLVESFTPAGLKGIIVLSGPDMVAQDNGEFFGEQMSALGNCMKKKFGGDDTPFYYTMPTASLAPKITKPATIKGRSEALEISDWKDGASILNWIGKAAK
jgi:sialate O-acetylesterase